MVQGDLLRSGMPGGKRGLDEHRLPPAGLVPPTDVFHGAKIMQLPAYLQWEKGGSGKFRRMI